MQIRGIIGVCLILAALSLSAAEKIRIHIISGSKEYKSEESFKEFVPWLEKNYHMTCTVSWGQDGVKKLQGLEHIKQADVLFVFARRMKLDEGQMKLIRAHWEAGKAVIGVRTASHAFQAADNELFDRKVMGGNYQGHFGIEPVKVLNVAKDHPVLRNVGAIPTSNRLYKAGPLAPTAALLQEGDIGKGRKHAVTWVNTWKGGRTFYTSLGVPADFVDADFKRLLVNAIFWTAKWKVPTTK